MHADAEIKFECSGCGQHLSVDATAAGQVTICPACQEPLTVPQEVIVGRIATITNLANQWTGNRSDGTRSANPCDSESSMLQEQLIDAVSVRARMERELASARVEIEALQAQLRRAWEERDQVTGKLDLLQAERRELERERAEAIDSRDGLERTIVNQHNELERQVQALRDLQDQVKQIEAERNTLSQELMPLRDEARELRTRASEVERLHREVAELRKDISSSRDAEQYHLLRLRTQTLEESQKEQLRELAHLRTEMDRLVKTEEELRSKLAEAQESCAAERRNVEALADGKVQRDNAILRAVLSRQKAELEHCYRDLKRYRRAQLGIRLAYALFALGLLGVTAFAMQTLPGLTDFLQSL